MKNTLTNIINCLFIGATLFFFTGCDLAVQEPYDFKEEVPTLPDFKNQTVWDWLQTQKSPEGAVTKATNKFDFLIEAIEYAGLQDLYRTGSNQTFVLLNNSAFNRASEIYPVLTGALTGPITKADKVRLSNLLKYHIVKSYIDQAQALPVWGRSYEFESLLDGPNGKIHFMRNERYGISINSSTDLPTTRKSVVIVGHNYIFSNGIAHISANYARLTAF
jgi:Fasciclin domain